MRYCYRQLAAYVSVWMVCCGCSDGGIGSLLGFKGREPLPESGSSVIAKLQQSSAELETNPVRVGAQSNWKAIALGAQHLFAVNTSGELFAGVLPASSQNNTAIHLVAILSDLPVTKDLKIRFSATQACIGFDGDQLFCGPLSDNPLQPAYLQRVGGGASVRNWDLQNSALCLITTAGSLSCTQLPQDAAQASFVRQEASESKWSHVQVGDSSVCATRSKSSDDIGLFCGALPRDNASAVELTEVAKKVEWSPDGFRISGRFICARAAMSLHCGLAPTGLGQSSKMSNLTQVSIDDNNLFAMQVSPRGEVRLCAYDAPELKCAVLETQGSSLKTPVSFKQTFKGGPASSEGSKLYLAGNHVWIGVDGQVSAANDDSRTGSWYQANLGLAIGLQLKAVSENAPLYWSRIYPSLNGYAYVLQKASAADSQYTLWAKSLTEVFAKINKPQGAADNTWYYDPDNPSFGTSHNWACGLRQEGTVSGTNSLWCWTHGTVKWADVPTIPQQQ
ncbi:MAG: hypothetical protein AAF310_05590 [Myxococcota bacterium]